MKNSKIFKQTMAMSLILCLCFGVTGCRKTPNETQSEWSYYSYYEDGFSENNTDVTGGNGQQNSNNKNNSTGSGNKNNKNNKNNTTNNNKGNESNAENNNSTSTTDKKKKNQVTMLTWWDFSKTEKQRKEDWEKKTGTTVKLIKTTQGLYSTKLASLVMADNSPDLAAMAASSFPSVINKNLVIPINDYIDVNDSRLALSEMNAAKYNGKYYGMDVKGSQFTQMFVIYYNKDLFESRGVTTPTELWEKGEWNWDTFRSTAKEMTYTDSNNKKITGFSVAAGSFWEYWSVSTGTSMVGYDSSTSKFTNNYSNASVINGWEFANDLLYKEKCAKVQGNLTDGDVAMTGGGQWYMWKDDVYDKQMKDDWSVVPWPSPEGKQVLPAQIQLWCLCKGGSNPEKSVDFLYYWLDPSNSKTEDVYASTEIAEVHKKLWNMEKSYTWTKGPVSYQDVNAYDSLMKQLYQCQSGSVTTVLQSNSAALNANIKLIEQDKVNIAK